jgi:hypothetical protein
VGESDARGHLEALCTAAAAIVSNADYVLHEVDMLNLPDDWRGRIRSVWNEVYAQAQQTEASLRRAQAGAAPPDVEELEWSHSRLGQAILELDGVLRTLWSAAEKDPALSGLSVLSGESSANVLRSYADLRRHAEELHEALPTPIPDVRSLREQAGLPEGMTLKQDLLCASCGKRAASLEIAPDTLSGKPALIYSGLVRQQAFRLSRAPGVYAAIVRGSIGEAHTLLGDEGIDAYCPVCASVYCREHYRLETEYDGDSYDCTRGTCPSGHRRMLDD